ncbi:MAG: inner membrane-spanning protein YciB [Enterobacterales bacterium]|nr:inner membrane-spanning protein YciB [Enterobacterales bacterium]
MKFFLDFFPIVVFVGVYSFSKDEQPMYPAVIALMVATLIQNIGTRLLTGKFEKLHLWTLVITVIFGSMTLIFRQPAFIFWKASVLVWVTALVFLYRQHILGKILLQEMFEKGIDQGINAPEKLWRSLNHLWAFSYFLFGFLNIYVAYEFNEAFWVKFKLIGLMGLNFALLFYIIFKLYPYFPMDEETPSDSEN